MATTLVTPTSGPSRVAWDVASDDPTAAAAVSRVKLDLPAAHQSLPAVARDDSGTVYVALVERVAGKSTVAVFRFIAGKLRPLARIAADEVRAPGRPALVGLASGVLVAFSGIGPGTRHRIFYATVRFGWPVRARSIADDGTRGILPAVARVGDRMLLVWESNAAGIRTIRATTIAPDGAHDAPVTLSSATASSNNPDVVATRDGAFAAWDSFRGDEWDLYGARWQGRHWSAEQRLTEDPRLERHVSLASRGDQIWLAWQAEAFVGNKSLSSTERRVLLGRLGAQDRVTDEVFDLPSATIRSRVQQDGGGGLTRPHLAAGGDGRLWVSARQSLGSHAGWAAIARSYRDGAFGPALLLLPRQGRWTKAPLVADGDRLLAAVQWDQQGVNFGEEIAATGTATSGVVVVPFAVPAGGAAMPAARVPQSAFRARQRVERSNAAQRRQTRDWHGRKLSLYWGNLHAHSALSTFSRSTDPPPEDVLVLERDLDRLDFCALTDHDFNLDEPSWAYTQEAVARYDDPGFVALLGQEWTSSNVPPARPDQKPLITRYGHHNLIFRNPSFPRFADSTTETGRSPVDVFAMLGDEDFVMIPHGLADWQFQGVSNPPVDWSSMDEVHSPLAEIYQRRGSYECLGCLRQAPDGAPFAGHYLRDAWRQGIVIGTIAAPDHGGGDGYAGVWAEDLSAEALFRAFHQRHTLGTTGEKTALFFSAGDAMMGDKVERKNDEPVPIEVWASSATPIEEVVVFRNGEPVLRRTPGEREVEIEWRDEPPPELDPLWYYVRVRAAVGTPQEGGEPRLAWSSPIWFYDTLPPPRRVSGGSDRD